MSTSAIYRQAHFSGAAMRQAVMDRTILRECVAQFVGAEIPRCMTVPTIIRKVRSWLNVSARHHVTRAELFHWLHYVYEQAVGHDANFDYSMKYHLYPGNTRLHVKTEWGGWAREHWLDSSHLRNWQVDTPMEAGIDWIDNRGVLVMDIMTPDIFKGLEEKCV